MTETSHTSRKVESKPRSRAIARLYTRLNVLVYQLSKGRLMNTIQGRPICLVDMIGAKSGDKRTTPLVYVPDGDALLLVASMGGAPTHPAWYYNLKATPQVTIDRTGVRAMYHATLLEGEEHSQAWSQCVQHFSDYQVYQERTDRLIPVFKCTPSNTVGSPQ